ncbi:MAG: hypothetical protein ACLP1X_19165 [Polyangiaceae bacterium]
MSLHRVAALAVFSLAAGACASITGLSGYSTDCTGGCVDASVVDAVTAGDAIGEGAADDSPRALGADAEDGEVPGDANPSDFDGSDASTGCDGASCSETPPSATSWACPKGGCNGAGGACSASGPCFCTGDSQCNGGKCVKVTGQNDVSCATCTGTGAADGFDCQLGSPGIPASCAVGFGYTPSNFAPATYTPPSAATTIDCATTYDSTSHAFTGWCSGQTKPTVTSGVAQSGGPNMDVLAFAGLTIASSGTLTLTGGNAVVLAVYGDATIAGAIHADGATGTSNSTTAGASGPGGNYDCGSSAGTSQPSNGHCSAGAGGGASAAGGTGAGGVGGATAAGGTARANASLKPLYGGCPGGTSGSWACQTSGGGGGGALQISVAGTLTVSGTLTANGGSGGTSTCFSGGCGANGYGGGGGGSGSGGAILLEGPSVNTAGATITPNGGTGGDPNTTGGGGAGPGGQGGAGGTSASPTGGNGTGSTANGCGSYTDCGGGGGGGYGYLTVNGGEGAAAYSCTTTLSPTPVCSSAHSACLCVADSDCATGKCVSAAQCSGSCSGTGTADVAGCQIVMGAPTAYGCSKGNCSDVTSPSGTCSAVSVSCWCTGDSQCPGGTCVNWPGCAAGACTGSGTPDGFHCNIP